MFKGDIIKTLLIYSRVCDEKSLHTQKIFDALKNIKGITTIKLDGSKPFDVKKHQELINQFDQVIMLFTINWYNIPWDLSRYLKEVWRVGDIHLENKSFYNIVTAGGTEENYSREGLNKASLSEYLINLDAIYRKMKIIKRKDYFYYGCLKYDEKRLNSFIEKILLDFSKNIN